VNIVKMNLVNSQYFEWEMKIWLNLRRQKTKGRGAGNIDND
jgi:hypothetical protein